MTTFTNYEHVLLAIDVSHFSYIIYLTSVN